MLETQVKNLTLAVEALTAAITASGPVDVEVVTTDTEEKAADKKPASDEKTADKKVKGDKKKPKDKPADDAPATALSDVQNALVAMSKAVGREATQNLMTGFIPKGEPVTLSHIPKDRFRDVVEAVNEAVENGGK